jgi:geranylgeranyl transferase type-2 subunit beta
MNQIIDDLLLEGVQRLSYGLRNRVADYVLSRRQADGGYPGRSGGSDIYYTDFALRILAQTRPEEVLHPATCAYAQWNSGIANIPECLNRLSIAGLCGVPLHSIANDCLIRHRLPSGCFCHSTDFPTASAYCTFLGAICEDLLGLMHQSSIDSFEAILKLQLPDGGFVDTGSGNVPQTNATSAAVGYLLRAFLSESPLTEAAMDTFATAIDKAAAYLTGMQAKEGGFFAHSKAPYPDLLSTFTALATLIAMGRIKQVDLRKHVQFVGSLAYAKGGFSSCAVDMEQDIEYTYYGLGCLALVALTIHDREPNASESGLLRSKEF